jgi:hypothetical protein
MAWTTDLVLFVRSLIGDLDATKYNNDRIKQVIAVSAFQINSSNFKNTYTVDIGAVTISPDPTIELDQDFCNLAAYKAASIIVGGEVKNMSNQAISYREGPNSLDLSSAAQATKALYDDLCKKYSELSADFAIEQSSEGGQAILGPYSPGSDFIAFFRGQDHRSNNL